MPLVSMDAHLAQAQTEVATVINRGSDVTLSRASTKDKGGRELTGTPLVVKAFPVRFSPFDRKTIAKVSWADETDVIFTIEYKNRNWKKFRALYQVAKHDSVEYDITHVVPYGAFADTFLYMLIGGVKKS